MRKTLKALLIYLIVCFILGTVAASAATSKLEKPTIKSVVMKSPTTAQIKWTKVKNAQKYELYVSIDGGKFKQLKALNALTYTHKNLKEGSIYRYKIRGVNGNKKGDFSVVYKLKVPAHKHKVVKDPSVKATCTSKGKTSGSHCATCGKILKEQKTVPKLDHTAVVDPGVEATCTKKGKTEGSHCSVCGKVLVKQKEIPKLNHTIEIDPAVEPTTTSTGLTEGSHCSVCGKVIVQRIIVPALTMEPWDYYMLLKDEMIAGGHVNTSGNPFISYTDSDYGVKAGIVYNNNSDSFEFIFTMNKPSYSTYVDMEVGKDDVERGLVKASFAFTDSPNSNYPSGFESEASIEMATYDGSYASVKTVHSALVYATKVTNLTLASIKTAFSTWDMMLKPYEDKGIDLHNLGFSSYNR